MVKRCVLVVGGCTIAVLVVVLVVFLVVVLCKKNNFKDTFIQDCERKTAEGHR